ncbi:hypothetical protein QQZ08_002595 [Neonectria magnoliae]|uniref:PPPDE domain-containing protein n=1 Tax=Neonectria magnoliae TaxID=2732573 RepID=A0ABR1IBU7_9HYPO
MPDESAGRAARQAAVLPVNTKASKVKRRASFERALRKEFDDGVRKQVQLRLEQESQTDRGERIWVSHHVENGQLKHWALLTHGYKYELRLAVSPKKRQRIPDVEEGILIRDRDRWTSMGRWGRYYEYRIQPCTLYEERRREAVAKYQFPAVAGFYSSLISWTRKLKAQVDADCKATFEKFGRYSLFGNNCQHFLRNFAVKIVEDKADDWEWFFQSTVSSYRYVSHGSFAGPVAVAAAWLERLKEMRPLTEGEDRKNLDENIKRVEEYLAKQKGMYNPGNPGEGDS